MGNGQQQQAMGSSNEHQQCAVGHSNVQWAKAAGALPELGAQFLQGLLRLLGVLDEEQVLLLQLSIDLEQGAGVLEVHGALLLLLHPWGWRWRLLHTLCCYPYSSLGW